MHTTSLMEVDRARSCQDASRVADSAPLMVQVLALDSALFNQATAPQPKTLSHPRQSRFPQRRRARQLF